MIEIRATTPEDLPAIAAIYRDAVLALGPAAYTAAQVAAWAAWPEREPDEFRRRCLSGIALLLSVGGEPAAFAQLDPPGHLDFLYCRGDYARRGFATRLHGELESHARAAGVTLLHTEASKISRPVFTRLGYEVREIEQVVRGGESFERYRMVKILGPGVPATTDSCLVVAAHTPETIHVPRVAAGETIAVTGELDPRNPGWFHYPDQAGQLGYCPVAWFDLDSVAGTATARRDYNAAEVAVAPGDIVHLIETESGWHRVLNTAGAIGWIPATSLTSAPAV